MVEPEFQLVGSPEAAKPFRPKEPLISMLYSMNIESLRFTLDRLNNYSNERELEDMIPEVGISRREYIQHVHYVMNNRS